MSNLEFPPVLHGPARDVRRRLTAAVKAFVAGTPWNESIGAGPPIAVSTARGLIVLNGPAPLLAGEPHFQAFLPLLVLLEGVRKGNVPESKVEEAVSASLATAWGLLGVLSNPNQRVVLPPARHLPIARAALAHWGALTSIGPRYSAGLREGKELWEVPNNLGYVLGQLGVPADEINRPWTGEQVKALLASVAGDGDIPSGSKQP